MPQAKDILDHQFLEMRWRILSLAADLDRIQRADGGDMLISSDSRIKKLRESLNLLLQNNNERAARVQDIFSDKTPPPG